MERKKFWGIAIVAGILCLFTFGTAQAGEIRAIWITRWDYKSADDIHQIVRNCAQAGFTDILFQIRGNGTVFYPSRYEAWAWELTGEDPSTTGKDPGWDPLQTAIREAKASNLRIHAYANVFPGWRGTVQAPKASGQLWNKHPEWFMVDPTGWRMKPTSKWYTFLTPTRPDVRNYLQDLFAEIAAYDLDGIHLDYFRFPADYSTVNKEHFPKASQAELKKHSDFSYDDVSLDEFSKTYGKKPSEFPQAWDDFRRDGVTRTLQAIRRAAGDKADDLVLSSAVLADFEKARNEYFQDSPEWIRRRYLDWIVPMNYNVKSHNQSLDEIKKSLGAEAFHRVCIDGINVSHNTEQIVKQVTYARASGCQGHAFFAYSTLFPGHKPNKKMKALSSRLYGQ